MKRRTFAGVALWIAAASATEAAAPLPVYFDPVFDPVCRVVTPAPTGEVWDAAWVWHPGQLQAHRQAAILRDSKARCVNVDYPSRYNPRATKTYFRTVRELGDYRVTGGAKLSRADGRTVLAVETVGRMPALIARSTSPADWETSLDGERWVPAESDPQLTRPGVLPETWEPEIVELPSRARTVLSPGEWIEDFRYVQLGTVTFRASGKGVLSFVPGESVEEARCDNWSIHEQPPVPDVTVDGTDVRVTLPERAMRYLRMRVRAGNVSVRDVMRRGASRSRSRATTRRSTACVTRGWRRSMRRWDMASTSTASSAMHCRGRWTRCCRRWPQAGASTIGRSSAMTSPSA